MGLGAQSPFEGWIVAGASSLVIDLGAREGKADSRVRCRGSARKTSFELLG
jgi:hypothetical protein